MVACTANAVGAWREVGGGGAGAGLLGLEC